MSTTQPQQQQSQPSLSGVGLAAAILVLVLFGALVGYLISQAGVVETRWTRLAWLFSSVEAIAFGAAGALFGSSIQRQRAEKAETAASKNADDAARGRALAAAIKADDPANAPGRNVEGMRPADSPDAPSTTVATRHASLARELFP